MRRSFGSLLFLLTLLQWLATEAQALSARFRVIWQQNPAHQVTIGWDQVSGENPVLLLDVNDFGKKSSEYAIRRRPDRIQVAKGMNNHFVRLENLIPNTTYYFLIQDSEGLSERMYFTTAPNTPEVRLSIVAGGDSRNNRDARRDANMLAGKLRPHCILFGGDFTGGDTPGEWIEWFDDWQLVITSDGRMAPIVVTRGNHEENNQVLVDLFDLYHPQAYYAFSIGGNLLRIYTLNTLIPAGGDQKAWLGKDLATHRPVIWKIAQYHHPMRPHTSRKSERNDLVSLWAPLFQEYGMNVAIECDAHVAKITWPIRPFNGPGSDEGFIRDDEKGTIYLGEGCWGAPLREFNDAKNWTRAGGSFNHFSWIFADQQKFEIRTVKTDGASQVAEADPKNIFKAPRGLILWSPPDADVIYIHREESFILQKEESLASKSGENIREIPPLPRPDYVSQEAPATDETANWESCPQIISEGTNTEIAVRYTLDAEGDVIIRIINQRFQEVSRLELKKQIPKDYVKHLKVNHLPAGRYLAIVKNENGIIQRYRILRR